MAEPTTTTTAALVTGASAGIGMEMARSLARRGHHLVLVARRRKKLEALASELRDGEGIEAHVVPADLTDPDAPRAVASAVERIGTPVSILVNNAGLGQYGPYLELDGDRELDQIMVNVVALTRLTRLLLPPMVERRHGRILNVASTAAFLPGPLMSVYYATKAYVLSYSVALREELDGTGVTVTCFCPGPTESEFHDRAGLENSKLFQNQIVWTAPDVAEAGVEAALRGDAVHVPGLLNKVNAAGARFVPRTLLAKITRAVQSRR